MNTLRLNYKAQYSKVTFRHNGLKASMKHPGGKIYHLYFLYAERDLKNITLLCTLNDPGKRFLPCIVKDLDISSLHHEGLGK